MDALQNILPFLLVGIVALLGPRIRQVVRWLASHLKRGGHSGS